MKPLACWHVWSGGSAWEIPPAGGYAAASSARPARHPDQSLAGQSSPSLYPTDLTASMMSGPYCSHHAETSTDRFSRHAGMFAVSTVQLTAAGTADTFIDQRITLWGWPVNLLSENGLRASLMLASAVHDHLRVNKVNRCVPALHHRRRQTRQPRFAPHYPRSVCGKEQYADWNVVLPRVASA